jgi:hypothetical protein
VKFDFLSRRNYHTAFIDLAARQSTNNFQATTEISRDRFSVLFVACRSVELIAVFLFFIVLSKETKRSGFAQQGKCKLRIPIICSV